jgi:Golgi phosphoprotein 3 (GPP34)
MRFYPGDVHRSVLDVEHSRLHGTGRVADDLYLIAHHEASGKPYLSPRAAGIGLAGGLLAELLVALRPAVTLNSGYLFPLYERSGEPVARYARPDEPVVSHVLDLIVAESLPLPVRDWLLFLGQTAAAKVAGRLELSGYLTRPESRIPWRTHRPVPVEQDWSQCAVLRAHAALDMARPLAPYPALLTALTLACGLGFRFSGLSSAPVRSAEEATGVLPRPLQELIACVQVTADAAVLSARK